VSLPSHSAVDWQLGWNVISETAALATALHGSIVPSEDGQRAYVERVPFGVVLGISRECFHLWPATRVTG
jgi:acyl-CoA reductase-like NAD-dependent aldehyde dehydrogenase